MKNVGLVLVPIVVAAAALGASRGASAPIAAGTVLDRTMLCSVGLSGGVYEFEIRAYAGYRDKGAWGRLPFVVVSTGGTRSRATTLDDSLAWVSAAKPAHATDLLDVGDARIHTPAQQYGTLALNTRECRPSKATVPLSAKGLRDAAPGPLGEVFDCRAPRRVLVRVRTVAASRPLLYRERYFTKTKTAFRESYVAVRTEAGKQLAFAAAFENGKARLSTTVSCVAD